MKNEEKATFDTNKRGKLFGSGNTVRRKDFSGTSEALNKLQVKFDCWEGNEGGRFLECLILTTAYLSTKLEVSGDIEMLIQNGKVFDPEWPDPVGPNTSAMKAMLQAEYGKRDKRVENIRINLSTAYILVIRQCMDYLWSRLKGQEKW